MQKELIILGAGESGIGAAILAKKLNMSVFVTDFSEINTTCKTALNAHQIEWEENGHSTERILKAQEIVKSPGVPDKAKIVQQARSQGISIISEIEFASRHTPTRIIAITGSNGKTTTTMLTNHLLQSAGITTRMGGNIGYSFARLVAQEMEENLPKDAVYVLEISSFQLDDIQTFHPYISMLLNITPDHLDRYDYQIEKYTKSKFKITQQQTAEDYFIFNKKDTISQNYLKENNISAKQIEISDDFFVNGQIQIDGYIFDVLCSKLRGIHNFFNATCALKAGLLLGADAKLLQKGLESYQPPEHRLEFVTSKKGIDFINDSKATNVDSVFWALSAMEKPTVLILGGIDKGNDYSQIDHLVTEKVKAIIAMGKDNTLIIKHFEGKVSNLVALHSMEAAVEAAVKIAANGEVVLLSPACASFDLFKNYEDRGQQFKKIINNL